MDYEEKMNELEEKLYDIITDLMLEYPDKNEPAGYVFSMVKEALDNVEEDTYNPESYNSVTEWLKDNGIEE